MRSLIAFSVIEMRCLIALAVAASAFFASWYLPPSDFAQDYLAARAARENSDPNAPSRLLAARFGVPASAVTSVQTAHPPMVTAFALPLAGLTWPRARAVWEFCLCAIAAVLILCSGIRALDLALLSPAWIFGLALGNLDAVVICLSLLALQTGCRRTGVWLGIATALKVYPALLILGLIVTRRYADAFLSLVVGGVLTLTAAGLIGFESLIGWLRFIPHNSDAFAVSMLNLSLTKIAAIAGVKTVFVTLLGIAAVAIQYKRATLDPLLPAILLVSPLSWLQSLPLLSNRLTRRELTTASVCSFIIAASWYSGVQWAANVGVLASFALTGLIAVVYVRILSTSVGTVAPTAKLTTIL